MASLYEMSLATQSNIEIPAPPGKQYLPYQKAGIEYALKVKHTLFADPPGLGKTIEAIGFKNAKGIKRALVICPASLRKNWEREILGWDVSSPKVEIYSPGKFKKENRTDVLIFSYGHAPNLAAVADVVKNFEYDLCIIDEIHQLKEPKAKRTKYILAKNGLAGKAKHIIALSGTPMVNRPIELFTIIKTLGHKAINEMSFHIYGIRFCGGFESEWGWSYEGATDMKELGRRLRSHFMVRRQKADVLKDLPEKFPSNIVFLDKAPGTANLIKRMLAFDVDTVIKGAEKAEFTELSNLRLELGLAKIKPAVEYIKTQLESGHEKIVLFAHHREVVAGLYGELKAYNPVFLVGGMKDPQASVDTFQNDKRCRLFIATIGAGGVGHTLTAASYVILVEPSYVPGDNEQAIDRCHRIGQTEAVQSDYLVFENSLDLRVLQILIKKSKDIKELYT